MVKSTENQKQSEGAGAGSADPGSARLGSEEYVMQRSRQMKQQQPNDRHKRKRNYSNKNKLLPEENEREKLPVATLRAIYIFSIELSLSWLLESKWNRGILGFCGKS